MDIIDSLYEGIKKGVNRQWSYTKDLLTIKPEYLITISVADALSNGFNSYFFQDIIIKLEEDVDKASNHSLIESVGLKNYFDSDREWIKRSGRADIFISCPDQCFVIEIKGLNPSVDDVKKEVGRFIDFLTIYNGNNNINICYLAFPSLDNRSKWIGKHMKTINIPSNLTFSFVNKGVKTDETPEDGIPFYYCNVLSINCV